MITEIGFLPLDDQFEAPKPIETTSVLETTVSPRYAKSVHAKGQLASAESSLRHLRDPDQPTPVSKQINGIHRTEAQIFTLANNVRILQKMNGKTKSKLTSNKEETLPDESPEEILRSLVNIGYIDESDVIAIKSRLNAPKPANTIIKDLDQKIISQYLILFHHKQNVIVIRY